jgi:hypothetical protein
LCFAEILKSLLVAAKVLRAFDLTNDFFYPVFEVVFHPQSPQQNNSEIGAQRNGVNTVFCKEKGCISCVGIHQTNGKRAKQKASGEEVTRSPRGLPEAQASPICLMG